MAETEVMVEEEELVAVTESRKQNISYLPLPLPTHQLADGKNLFPGEQKYSQNQFLEAGSRIMIELQAPAL